MVRAAAESTIVITTERVTVGEYVSIPYTVPLFYYGGGTLYSLKGDGPFRRWASMLSGQSLHIRPTGTSIFLIDQVGVYLVNDLDERQPVALYGVEAGRSTTRLSPDTVRLSDQVWVDLYVAWNEGVRHLLNTRPTYPGIRIKRIQDTSQDGGKTMPHPYEVRVDGYRYNSIYTVGVDEGSTSLLDPLRQCSLGVFLRRKTIRFPCVPIRSRIEVTEYDARKRRVTRVIPGEGMGAGRYFRRRTRFVVLEYILKDINRNGAKVYRDRRTLSIVGPNIQFTV
jgi:hypothetical protein